MPGNFLQSVVETSVFPCGFERACLAEMTRTGQTHGVGETRKAVSLKMLLQLVLQVVCNVSTEHLEEEGRGK